VPFPSALPIYFKILNDGNNAYLGCNDRV